MITNKSHFKTIFVLTTLILGLAIHAIPAQAQTGPWSESRTVGTVNGHAGYTTEWRGYDQLDKPVVVALGYDPEDDDTAVAAANDYSVQLDEMNAKGYDIIIFDYLDGDADIRDNAENLEHFITYLDSRMVQSGFSDTDNDGHPDYELALIGASMGGIVSRTMFVQTNENMGVDIFATLDSPHYGVYVSSGLSWVTAFISNTAGQQMLHGSSEYNSLYGYLQQTEQTSQFMTSVIDPMDTAALALSNGEGVWWVSWSDDLYHTKYHPVSSYVDSPLGSSDFIPYHSAIYADSSATVSAWGWGGTYYAYQSTTTSYFDTKIQNQRAEHGGPTYIIQQAMDFVDASWEV